MLDPSGFVGCTLPPDDAFYDILHDTDVVRGLEAFVQREQNYFDVELLAPDQTGMWVRVTPTLWEKNPDHDRNWRIDDGMCQRLTLHGTPDGPVGSCNGYFIIAELGGHTVGKLNVEFPQE